MNEVVPWRVGQPFLAVRLFPNPSQGHDIGDSGQQPEHQS